MNRTLESNSISWKETFYEHLTSKDGKRTWRASHTKELTYRTPGLFRTTSFDDQGQIRGATIRDAIKNRKLSLDFLAKRALISEEPKLSYPPAGPFAGLKESLDAPNLQWVETRETPVGRVNVFRHTFEDRANGRNWSYDFWIAQLTKRLVALHIPGRDIYDPDSDPFRLNAPEMEWSYLSAIGSAQHDIVFDANLDESLFSLEPPSDFAVERQAPPPQVTEGEAVEYLGVLAEFNDNTFPDQLSPVPFSSDRLNRVWQKPQAQRSVAEQKLLDTNQHYMRLGLGMPLVHFLNASAEPGSFRYLGKGVKVGDSGRQVCWYRLKGALTYRTVYGDLTAKDVASEELPLAVEES
jgi:hypothetical protein